MFTTLMGWLTNPWIFGILTLVVGVILAVLTFFGVLKVDAPM
jgi:uncharacterized membrane protein